MLCEEYSLHQGSGGAGRRRGGFGLNYTVRLRRSSADGSCNRVRVTRNGEDYIPPYLSKDQDIAIAADDTVRVSTPGGDGYGDPLDRDPQRVASDVVRGYYTAEQAEAMYAVKLEGEGEAENDATTRLREQRRRERKGRPP